MLPLLLSCYMCQFNPIYVILINYTFLLLQLLFHAFLSIVQLFLTTPISIFPLQPLSHHVLSSTQLLLPSFTHALTSTWPLLLPSILVPISIQPPLPLFTHVLTSISTLLLLCPTTLSITLLLPVRALLFLISFFLLQLHAIPFPSISLTLLLSLLLLLILFSPLHPSSTTLPIFAFLLLLPLLFQQQLSPSSSKLLNSLMIIYSFILILLPLAIQHLLTIQLILFILIVDLDFLAIRLFIPLSV